MIGTPGQIERGSMEIIRAELRERGVTLPMENEAVILRCIHASADFDYATNLRFTPGAVRKATEALRGGQICALPPVRCGKPRKRCAAARTS